MAQREFDVVVVGAGFAGMYLLHRLRGQGFRVRVLEAGGGVGGTWYWNRYPGARCDVESVQYSYQFDEGLQQEWDWSERYAPQPEILRYAEHVADRFDLKRDIDFDTRVTAARFDDETGRWTLTTEAGETIGATWCVMATGCLSSVNTPAIPGLDRFAGALYHTGNWPHAPVDFAGRRVAVVGTGSSAIQSIPAIADQADHLYVFQRTAHYTVPAHNRPLDADYRAAVKASYPEMRARARSMPPGIDMRFNPRSAVEADEAERAAEYEARWADGGLAFMGAFRDLMLDPEANRTAADFVRGKIARIVDDPATAAALTPDIVIGCKRLCVDTGYWATFNRPNVTLVDISKSPIEEVTREGVRALGRLHAVDAIVLATGFDAMTGALLRIDIAGVGGRRLAEKWADGPRSYLGLAMAGFPNLFTVTGPGSPSVLTNMLPTIEQHVEWIADCIGHLRDRGLARIEATREAEDAWVGHVGEVAGKTLRSTCSSWYVGANVAGKPRVFMPYIGGFPVYVEKCREIVANGYEGFVLA